MLYCVVYIRATSTHLVEVSQEESGGVQSSQVNNTLLLTDDHFGVSYRLNLTLDENIIYFKD